MELILPLLKIEVRRGRRARPEEGKGGATLRLRFVRLVARFVVLRGGDQSEGGYHA